MSHGHGRLFTYTLLCLAVAGWLTYLTIRLHHHLAIPSPSPTAVDVPSSTAPPSVPPSPPPLPLPSPAVAATPAAIPPAAPARRRVQSFAALPAAPTPAPLAKGRAVAHPSTAKPTLIPYDGFPAADNGKMFRVRCDGAQALCVVTNGRCVSLMELVPDVPHSCVIGFDEDGNGGVAFLSATIRIE